MNAMGNRPLIWVHWHGSPARELKDVGLKRLCQGRLELCPRERQAHTAGGLFLFDRFSIDACQSLSHLTTQNPDRVVAVAVGADLSGAACWQLLQAGAADVLSWNNAAEPATELVQRFERWAKIEEIMHSPAVRDYLIGEGPAWVSVLREVIEVAHFTDSAILLTGETGTGKELVARLIHRLDRRPGKQSLIVLDCTTVVPELSGSEFFGHERGAFTHAVSSRDGAFALADGGTLFLDEVGELSPGLQGELLRVVQEHAYKRVGSNTWKQTNFRLICATNRDLREEEKKGTFRTDFYHRIAGWTCRLPSLAERQEDIVPLVQHFLAQMLPDGEVPVLTPAVRDYLLLRRYPGNVRELRQVIARIAHRHVGPGPITVGDIPEEERMPATRFMNEQWCDRGFENAIRHALAQQVRLREISARATETAIRIALEEEEENIPRAARRLGVTDRALQLRRAAGRRHHHDGEATN